MAAKVCKKKGNIGSNRGKEEAIRWKWKERWQRGKENRFLHSCFVTRVDSWISTTETKSKVEILFRIKVFLAGSWYYSSNVLLGLHTGLA